MTIHVYRPSKFVLTLKKMEQGSARGGFGGRGFYPPSPLRRQTHASNLHLKVYMITMGFGGVVRRVNPPKPLPQWGVMKNPPKKTSLDPAAFF